MGVDGMDKADIFDEYFDDGCYWKCKDGDCAMYYADLSADNNELEFGFNCEDNPDCYFKQLQRLKQENEELKDKITTLEDKLQLRMASDKESDEFWDEIFSAEDYPFNKENAYKELKDYYFVLEQIPKIYMEITGGTLSKTTYFASSVIQAYNDALERYYDKIDDLEYNNNAYRSALEKLREVAMGNKTTAESYKDCNSSYMQGVSDTCDRIMQIISEVLDA